MNILALIGRSVLNFVREFGQITLLFIKVVGYFPRVIKDGGMRSR